MSDVFVTALKILGRRDYFPRELEQKLVGQGFADDDAAEAVERCLDEGFIKPEQIAERFVEIRAAGRGWGPYRLRHELERRGCDSVLAEMVSQISGPMRDEALKVALRKGELRRRPDWWRLPRGRAQMISSLLRRGFDRDVAVAAVDRVVAEREGQTDDHAVEDHDE